MKTRWQRWIVWLLPFLVARALVPAGFMLSVVDGGLDLTFCPSVTSVAQAAGQHHDASHHDASHAHDQGEHSDHYRASDTSACPFGVAGGASMVANYALADFALATPAELLPSYTAPRAANRPIRAQRIRGPPAIFLT
jgi:hypothetical protein